MHFKFALVILQLLLLVNVLAADGQPLAVEGWGTIIDPDGDCSVIIKGQTVSIEVPKGAHDLSAELRRMNAPRMLQEVSGNFVVEVKIGGEFVTGEPTIAGRTAYNGAGLVLWQDDRNYIRLERAALKRAGQVRHYVNFEQRINGRITEFGTPLDFRVDDSQPCYLRMERKGEKILGSAKQGDDPWRALLPHSAPLPFSVKVGVAAINASDAPFIPQLSEFKLQTAESPSDANEPKQEDDVYAVPDAGVEDLVAFIAKIKSLRPRTRDDYIAHMSSSPKALATAADRILQLENAPTEARELAQRILFEQKVRSLARLNKSEQEALLDEVLTFCAASEASLDNAQLVFAIARGLESSDRPDLASGAYMAASELMQKSDSQDMLKLAQKLAGAAKRLKLPGMEMEIRATRADGEEFDLASLRGKVVLVDFWATWCGPCIAELPNLRKYYELYHEKGFEVVGVCLDSTRQKLQSFVETREIPWINLFEDEVGSDHPVAVQYGIMAIPTVILINADGKVISMNARGPELARLLETELGPIEKERLQEVEETLRSETAAP